MTINKRFVNIAIIVLVIIGVGIAGYFVLRVPAPNDNPPIINEPPTGWQFVDADSFTLYLPPGWEFNKLQGIDSYVGEFVGEGARLHFDFGWYSWNLAEDNDPDHIVTYETIDGYRAKIVVPKVSSNGITGVYFDDLDGKEEGPLQTELNLYGENLTLSQQKTALKIFRTLKIVKQTW